MSKVKQTVFLITERQRDGLIGYLQNRPYAEVAGAIQFLSNAPSAVLNVDVPEEKSESPSIESDTPAPTPELTSVG
jgi:hypothetical protein